MHPRFSVLINNYNYGQYLSDCISSVLNQNYPSVEIIVYDDGSKDFSKNVLESFKDRGVITILGENYGSTPNFNQANAIYRAFLRSTGDWVLLLDADDMFLENKLRSLEIAIQENPDAIMIQHPFLEVDADGNSTGRSRPFFTGVDYQTHVYGTNNLLFLFTQTSGLAFSRGFFSNIMPLEEDGRPLLWADVRLTRGAVGEGKIVSLRTPLGCYRVHGKNDSAKLSDRSVLIRSIKSQYDYFNELQRMRGRKTIAVPSDYISFKPVPLYRKVSFVLNSFGVRWCIRYLFFSIRNSINGLPYRFKNIIRLNGP
jgi:glycosyltransferase involved in cell wall biosynthesis